MTPSEARERVMDTLTNCILSLADANYAEWGMGDRKDAYISLMRSTIIECQREAMQLEGEVTGE